MQVEFKLPQIMWSDINSIKLNERNPRKITDSKFELLKTNIEKFPKMMGVRPVVIDQHGIIMGGNMRFRACSQLGWEKVPTIMFDESWTDEEMKMFVIVDNKGFGFFDYEIIYADYTDEELANYGVELDELNAYDDDLKEIEKDEDDETPAGKYKYELFFDTEDQRKIFKDFLLKLKNEYSDELTECERITKYINEQGL